MIDIISDSSSFLYRHVLKPVFFCFKPEFVHNRLVSVGQLLARIPVAQWFVRTCWAYEAPSLSQTINGITYPNPVGLSAGFDYNGQLTGITPAVGFGFHTIGTVTLEAYEGNPQPRLLRLPKSKALLVNKGLKNKGAKVLIKELLKTRFTIPTGISIASTNRHFSSIQAQISDITTCFQLFEKSKLKHAYYELNISCPNTFGGEPFTSPARLTQLLKGTDKLKLNKPLFVKMPIDQKNKQSLEMLDILAKHRVQGVIFGNLTKDKQNPGLHPDDRQTWFRHRGNVSGKPTQHRSTQLVRLTRRHFHDRFTIIGTGGIFSWQDAEQKLSAGADLVQLITGMIYEGPQLIGQINRGLAVKHTT